MADETSFDFDTRSEVTQVHRFEKSLKDLEDTFARLNNASLQKVTSQIDSLSKGETLAVRDLSTSAQKVKAELEALMAARSKMYADLKNKESRSIYEGMAKATLDSLKMLKQQAAVAFLDLARLQAQAGTHQVAEAMKVAKAVETAYSQFSASGKGGVTHNAHLLAKLGEDLTAIEKLAIRKAEIASRMAAIRFDAPIGSPRADSGNRAQATAELVTLAKQVTDLEKLAQRKTDALARISAIGDEPRGRGTERVGNTTNWKAQEEALRAHAAETDAIEKRMVDQTRRNYQALERVSANTGKLSGLPRDQQRISINDASPIMSKQRLLLEEFSGDLGRANAKLRGETAEFYGNLDKLQQAYARLGTMSSMPRNTDRISIRDDAPMLSRQRNLLEEFSGDLGRTNAKLRQETAEFYNNMNRLAAAYQNVGKQLAVPNDGLRSLGTNLEGALSRSRLLSSELTKHMGDDVATIKKANNDYYGELQRQSDLKEALRARQGTNLIGGVTPVASSVARKGPSLDDRDAVYKQSMQDLRGHYAEIEKASQDLAQKFKPVKLPPVDVSPLDPSKLSPISQAMRLFTGDAKDATSAARGLVGQLGGVTAGFQNLLPYLAGAAFGAGVKSIVSLGAQVDNTMSIIRSLSEESAGSMSMLNEQMLTLGRSGPYGPLAVADAMKTLSLAGLRAGEVVGSVKDVMNFAVAGDTSIEKAADVMTSVATAFNIASTGYNVVGDTIAKTAAVSKSSVESIGEAFKTASVINKQYGISLNDVGLGLASLSNLGIQGTAAGVALRNMYADLSERTPKVAKAMKAIKFDPLDKDGNFKDAITLVKDMNKALDGMSIKDRRAALRDMLSERGAKPIIELADAVKQKAKEMGQSFDNAAEEMRGKIAASAGFAGRAAAQMALTPLNQMKSVAATLQTTIVETFKGLEPTILEVSMKLKEVFNSAEFKTGLSSSMTAIGNLTVALVNNLDVIGKLAVAYVGFKALQGTVSIMQGMATMATGASTALLAMTAAQTAAGVAATAGAARLAGWLGVAARGLAIFTPIGAVVAAATAAWMTYSFFVDKAATSQKNLGSSNYANSYIESLQQETRRLNENTEAMLANITVEQLRDNKMRAAGANKVSGEQAANVAAAADALLDAKRKLAQAESKTFSADEARGGSTVKDAHLAKFKAEVRERQQFLETAEESQRMSRRATADAESNHQTAATKLNNLALKKAAEQAEKDRKEISKIYQAGGKPEKPKFEPFEYYKPEKKNDIAEMQAQQAKRMSELKSNSDNELAFLNNARQANAISEGEYLARSLSVQEQYEAESLDVLRNGWERQKQQFAKEAAQLVADQAKNKSPENDKKARDALADLGNKMQTASDAFSAESGKIAEQTINRIGTAANKTKGFVANLKKESVDYWNAYERSQQLTSKADQIAQEYRFLNDSIFSYDVARQAYAAAALDEEARHADALLKLQSELEFLQSTYQSYYATATAGGQALTEQGRTRLNQLQEEIAAVAALKGETERKVQVAVGNAGDRAARLARERQIDGFAGDLAGAVMTGLKEGGEAGKKSLRDTIKKHLIEKPFEIMIKATISELLGGALGMGGANQAGTQSSGIGGLMGQSGSVLQMMTGAKDIFGLYKNYQAGLGLTGGSGTGLSYLTGQSAIAPWTQGGANLAGMTGGDAITYLNSAQGWTGAGVGTAANAASGVTTSLPGFYYGGTALGAGSAAAGGLSLAGGALGSGTAGLGSLAGLGTTFSTAATSVAAPTVTTSLAGLYTAPTTAAWLTTGSTAIGAGVGGAATGAGVAATAAPAATGGMGAALGGMSATGWGAIVAVAILAAMAIFGGGGKGPKVTGGYNSNDFDKQVNHVTMTANGGTYGGPLDDKAKDIVTGVEDQYKSLIEAFGGTEGKITSNAFIGRPTNKGAVQLELDTYVDGQLAFSRYQNKGGNQENAPRNEEEFAKEVAFSSTKAVVAAVLKSDIDAPIKEYLGAIDLTKVTFEELNFALKRATAYAGFINVLESLPFENLKKLTMDAADELVRMAGGLEAFNSRLTSYYENYYSQGERTAVQTEQVSKAFAELGMTMPSLEQPADKARAAFRALVEAQDVNTEAGRKNYNALMSLSEAYAQLTPVEEAAARTRADIANERLGLEGQLLQLQGNTVEIRARERAALDETNRSLYDTIKALEDTQRIGDERMGLEGQILNLQGKTAEIRALERAQLDVTNQALYDTVKVLEDLADVSNERRGLEDQMLNLMGATDEIRKRTLAGLHENNRALQIEIWALEDKKKAAEELAAAEDKLREAFSKRVSVLEKAVNAENKALEEQKSAVEESISTLQSLFDFIKGQVSELYESVEGTKPQQIVNGNAFIDQALIGAQAGIMPKQDELAAAIQAARSGLDEGNFATQFERDKATLILANKLGQLQDKAGIQLSTAERTLKGIEAQIEQNNKILEYWQELLAKADGTYIATVSVAEAVRLLATGGNPPGTTPSTGTGGTSTGGVAGADGIIGRTPSQPASFGGGRGAYEGQPVYKYKEVYATTTAGTVYQEVKDPGKIAQLDKLSSIHATFNGTGNLTGLFTAIKAAGGTLKDLQTITGIGTMDDWRKSAASVNFPSFDVGTNYVPHDMLAQIHEGERIVPAKYNRSDVDNAALAEELRRIREAIQYLTERNTDENRAINSNVSDTRKMLDRVVEDDHIRIGEVAA